MRQIIELDEEDIVKIIAERFNADTDQVTINISCESRGWGEGEHSVNTVYVTVRKE